MIKLYCYNTATNKTERERGQDACTSKTRRKIQRTRARTHLAALLCVSMLEHVLLDEVHHLFGGVHVEEPVAAQQQELVLLRYRQHLRVIDSDVRREVWERDVCSKITSDANKLA